MNEPPRLVTKGAWLLALMLVWTGSAAWAGEVELTPEERERERQLLLESIRQTQAPARDLDIELDTSHASALGSPAAPLVMIELADYQCGFCRRHLQMVMPHLIRDYVDTNRLRYLFLEFPVEQRHPQALAAASAARCAGEQGRYWEMRQQLYSHPLELDTSGFRLRADALGLDRARFDGCIDSVRYEPLIRASMAQGVELMARGTPTFFLGWPVAGEKRVHLIRRIDGAQPYELFQREIDRLLELAGPGT